MRIGLLAHAAVVVAMPTAFVVTELGTTEGDGANIGGGLCVLLALILGLPWSLPAFQLGADIVGDMALFTSPIVNLILHALALRWLARRARSKA
jgi:hypothetical protein